MILYHACWDLVYIFGKSWNWYMGTLAYIWQQSICWSFIILSGFCWFLGKKHIKRGIIVFTAGAIVSLVTIVFMPENRVMFGVLTMIGCSMLLMIVFQKLVKMLPAEAGLILSAALFFLTRNINNGYLGFEGWNLIKLPSFLYHGNIMTFLGFMEQEFYSSDYFSLFPWFFLYLFGCFLYQATEKFQDGKIRDSYLVKGWEPLSFLGRHSLEIYIIHQPLIYGIFALSF